MTQNTADAQTPPPTLGAYLLQQRTQQGLTLEALARRTGLDVATLSALEADEHKGASVFVRGYLSRCARALHLPESEILARYSALPTVLPPLQLPHSHPRRLPMRDLRGVIYALACVGIGWVVVQNLSGFTAPRWQAWWTGNLVATTALVPTPPPISPPPPAAPSVVQPPSVTIATHSVATSTVSATVGHRRTSARLVLHLSADCWVEVKDAQGKVLANSLMKANTSHDLEGAAPFAVMLGNAPAARIAVDDRLVDTAVYVPRRGTVSRFTLNPPP